MNKLLISIIEKEREIKLICNNPHKANRIRHYRIEDNQNPDNNMYYLNEEIAKQAFNKIQEDIKKGTQ